MAQDEGFAFYIYKQTQLTRWIAGVWRWWSGAIAEWSIEALEWGLSAEWQVKSSWMKLWIVLSRNILLLLKVLWYIGPVDEMRETPVGFPLKCEEVD